MFEQSEFVSLVLAVPLSIPIILLARALRISHLYMLVGIFASALGAILFSLLEHIAFHGAFNLLEHICYAATGILAGIGCWRMALCSQRTGEHAP